MAMVTIPWPPLAGGGASGRAGTGGRLNDGGSAGAGGHSDGGLSSEASAELRALEACEVPDRCQPEAFVQLIENYTHNIPKDLVSCVLTGLAERRRGRYVYRTQAVFGNGSTEAKHVLVVAADGSVAYVRAPAQFSSGSAGDDAAAVAPDPAQRCTLKPPSYFEACLAAVQASTASDDGAAWACLFGDGTSTRASRLDWFDSCERESPPRCESGSAVVDGGDAGSADDAGVTGDAGADAAP
jgi:hypothetical protein